MDISQHYPTITVIILQYPLLETWDIVSDISPGIIYVYMYIYIYCISIPLNQSIDQGKNCAGGSLRLHYFALCRARRRCGRDFR